MGGALLREVIDLGGDGLIPLDTGDVADRHVAAFVPARAADRAGPVIVRIPTAAVHVPRVIRWLSAHAQGALAAAGGFPGILVRCVRHDVLLSGPRSAFSCGLPIRDRTANDVPRFRRRSPGKVPA